MSVSSSIVRRLPHPLYSSVFLFAFVGYFLIAPAPFLNSDTYWHLAAGDWILQHHAVPRENMWAFSAKDTPWYDISWLWDLALGFYFKYSGVAGIHVMGCLTSACTITLLSWSLKRRGQLTDGYIILTCALAWYVLYLVMFPIAQLATLFFAGLFQALLNRDEEAGVISKRNFIALPILMMIWANTHGGFLTGFIILGAYMVAARERRDNDRRSSLMMLGIICLLATFINPYGILLYHGVARTLFSVIQPYLMDWHPLNFGKDLPFDLLLGMFLLSSNVRDPNIRLVDKILTFVWLLAALVSRRNFPVFAILSAPYYGYCLQEFVRMAQRDQFRAGNEWFTRPRVRVRMFALAVIAVGTLVCTPFKYHLLKEERLSTDVDGVIPTLAFLKQHYPDTRFMNDYDLGSQILYLSGGTWPVFVDTRSGTAYSEPLLKEYIHFMTMSDSGVVLDKYNLRGVILRKSAMNISEYRYGKDWQKVYSNDKLEAYVKTSEKAAP